LRICLAHAVVKQTLGVDKILYIRYNIKYFENRIMNIAI